MPNAARCLPARSILCVGLAMLVALAATPRARAEGEIRYVTPTGSGARSGLSWKEAATLPKLSTLIAAAGPAGRVLVRADQGPYEVTSPIKVMAGGASDAPVRVEGVDGGGKPMQATIRGNRAAVDGEPGESSGAEVFRLLENANHLRFAQLSFENVGNGAFRIAADIKGIEIVDVAARNVGRFLENNASGDHQTASVDGLILRNARISGYSKGAVRLKYDSRGVLLEDVTGDSERQPGGLYVVGVHLEGSVHDVVLRRVTMSNSDGRGRDDQYWNGDGFATESQTRSIRFEDTLAVGNTDAGYDLKSSETSLSGARAQDNMRNFRIWGTSTLTACASERPRKRGGSGTQNHVWIGKGGTAELIRCTLVDDDPSTTVALVEKTGHLRLVEPTMHTHPAARQSRVEEGGTFEVVPKR